MDLSPDWVVGFVDGEGCFYVGINEHPEMTVGYQVVPEFRIVQHMKNLKVLYSLKKFFGCGVVRKNHDDRYELRIREIEYLKKICDFFQKHPLKTTKNVDIKKFSRVIRFMDQGKHLEEEGLKEIIRISMGMNRADKLKAKEILGKLDAKLG